MTRPSIYFSLVQGKGSRKEEEVRNNLSSVLFCFLRNVNYHQLMSTTGPRTVPRALNTLPHFTQDKTKMLSKNYQ